MRGHYSAYNIDSTTSGFAGVRYYMGVHRFKPANAGTELVVGFSSSDPSFGGQSYSFFTEGIHQVKLEHSGSDSNANAVVGLNEETNSKDQFGGMKREYYRQGEGIIIFNIVMFPGDSQPTSSMTFPAGALEVIVKKI